jgi:hypothetical protein
MAHPDTSPDPTQHDSTLDTTPEGTPRETPDGGTDLGGEDDSTFDPSEVDANRSIEQGNGVGQRELERQRDATGAGSSEHLGQMQGESAGRSDIERGGGNRGGVEQV